MVVIMSYQADMVNLLHQGYDGQTVQQRWAFPAALMFSLSVITTIGLVIFVITTIGLVIFVITTTGIVIIVIATCNM